MMKTEERCPWHNIIRGNWAVYHPTGLTQPKSPLICPPTILSCELETSSQHRHGKRYSTAGTEKPGFSSKQFLHFEGTASGTVSWRKTDLPPIPTTLLLTLGYMLLLHFPEQYYASRWEISSRSSKIQSGQGGRGEKKGDLESQVFSEVSLSLHPQLLKNSGQTNQLGIQ